MAIAMPASHAANPATLKPGVDLPGIDLRSMNLGQSADSIDYRRACECDPQCQAYAFVDLGVPESAARCWLRKTPPPTDHSALSRH